MKVVTILTVAIAAVVMLFAGVMAATSNATSSLCHSSKLAISAPASVKAGKALKVTGKESQAPAHTVKATLQSRLSTSKTWKNGASANLSGGSYSLKWKAPAKKGKYKVRVRVTHSGASNVSAAKTVTVK